MKTSQSNIAEIHKVLDGHRLLCFEEFTASGLVSNLTFDLDRNSRMATLFYLHYLAELGRTEALRNFLQRLSNEGEDVPKLINDTTLHDTWHGTPLHTAASWNGDPAIAKVLVEFGADPTIQNYYQEMPGHRDSCYMIPIFNYEFSLLNEYDSSSEDGEEGAPRHYIEHPDDFLEMDRYLMSLRSDSTPRQTT